MSSQDETTEKLTCVILAGGRGTRMKPFTDETPKALIPVAGKPFAYHQLALLAAGGVTDVVYSIGYRGHMIRAAIGDGRKLGLPTPVDVRYVDEGEVLRGTGGALRLCVETGSLPPSFLVLYGDSYLPIPLAPVVDAFRAAKQPALMTVLKNDGRWDKSNVIFQNRRVQLYDKARADPEMRYIDYGLTMLTRAVVQRLPAEGASDLAQLYKDLSLAGELAGFEVTERFYVVGSPDGLRDLEEHLARGKK